MPSVGILTLPGFNEIDSLVAFHILNRCPELRVFLAGPEREITSLFGLPVRIEHDLETLTAADAVILGSGSRTRDFVADPSFMARLDVDPARHLIASQCSGALFLAALGLVDRHPVCTDAKTRPWIEARGLTVVDRSFSVSGNLATAGGCLGAQVLAAWLLCRLQGAAAARDALAYVAPVGSAERFVQDLIDQAAAADPVLSSPDLAPPATLTA